jgi:hypothetical protein
MNIKYYITLYEINFKVMNLIGIGAGHMRWIGNNQSGAAMPFLSSSGSLASRAFKTVRKYGQNPNLDSRLDLCYGRHYKKTTE